MTPDQFNKYLANFQMNVKNAQGDLPRIAANEAARQFRKNFQDESFFGDPWEEVQRRQTKTVTYKTKSGKQKTKSVTKGKGADGSRKILTGRTADLGKSINIKLETGKAIVYSDLPYSAAHNEGTSNAGRGRKTKIPRRQFIGNHPVVQSAILEEVKKRMNQALNQK